MKTNILLLLLLVTFCTSIYSQNTTKRKHYFPIWTYHQDSITINGLSLGISTFDRHERKTNTNGIKLELIGMGWAVLFMNPPVGSAYPPSGYSTSDFSERINGFYLSGTGNVCDCLTNGVSLGFISQNNAQVNGLSTSSLFNYSEVHNGIQITGMANSTDIMNGLQIASFNSVYEGKGVQIALIGNTADTEFKGVQIAVSNYADKIKGIQIGIFNKSANLKGIQIGLWNVNQKRKMPIINWNFER